MGQDSRLHIPPVIEIKDIVVIFPIIIGATPTKYVLPKSNSSVNEEWIVEVSDPLKIQEVNVPGLVALEGRVKGKDVYFWFHWNSQSFPGWREISCSYHPARIPALTALADFLGGVLDINDCDNSFEDFVGDIEKKPYSNPLTLDGRIELNKAMMELKNKPGWPYAWTSSGL